MTRRRPVRTSAVEQSIQRSSVHNPLAKARFGDAYCFESTCKIELSGMRIADDVQGAGSERARHILAMLQQLTSDSLPPHAWLYKKRIEFRVTTQPRQNCREADNGFALCSNVNLPGLQLINGNVDGIWMRQNCFPVSRVGERSASLQRLQIFALRSQRTTNAEPLQISAASSARLRAFRIIP